MNEIEEKREKERIKEKEENKSMKQKVERSRCFEGENIGEEATTQLCEEKNGESNDDEWEDIL